MSFSCMTILMSISLQTVIFARNSLLSLSNVALRKSACTKRRMSWINHLLLQLLCFCFMSNNNVHECISFVFWIILFVYKLSYAYITRVFVCSFAVNDIISLSTCYEEQCYAGILSLPLSRQHVRPGRVK